MSRIIFAKRKQRLFLERVHSDEGLTWPEIAHLCKVSERTLRDWRREKFFMPYESAKLLSRKTSVLLPPDIKILPEHWVINKIATIGARKRYELYGNPGTPEGRRKGGINSQRKFQEDPCHAGELGIKVRKCINKPPLSPLLAEFFGILLGDGGLSYYQARITFDTKTDKGYAIYIQKLIRRLFGLSPSIMLHSNVNDRAADILISSRNLVEFLIQKGLKVGNKIRNNSDISLWIKNKKDYKIACIRGLIDTDGSFYTYKHRVNKREYRNFSICFTNRCKPLLNSVYSGLKEIGLRPSRSACRIYLHRIADINNYIKIVGSHNPKHINKYRLFIKGGVRKRP